jgi:hypothetical protein
MPQQWAHNNMATNNDDHKGLTRPGIVQFYTKDPANVFGGDGTDATTVDKWFENVKAAIPDCVKKGRNTGKLAVNVILRHFLKPHSDAFEYGSAWVQSPQGVSDLSAHAHKSYQAAYNLARAIRNHFRLSAQFQLKAQDEWTLAPNWPEYKESYPGHTVLSFCNELYRRFRNTHSRNHYSSDGAYNLQFNATLVNRIDGYSGRTSTDGSAPDRPLHTYLTNGGDTFANWEQQEYLSLLSIIQKFALDHPVLFSSNGVPAQVNNINWQAAGTKGDKICLYHGPGQRHDTEHCNKLASMIKDGKLKMKSTAWRNPGSTVRAQPYGGIGKAGKTAGVRYGLHDKGGDDSMRGRCFACGSADHSRNVCPIPQDMIRKLFMQKCGGRLGKYDQPDKYRSCPRCGYHHSLRFCLLTADDVRMLGATINIVTGGYPPLPVQRPTNPSNQATNPTAPPAAATINAISCDPMQIDEPLTLQVDQAVAPLCDANDQPQGDFPTFARVGRQIRSAAIAAVTPVVNAVARASGNPSLEDVLAGLSLSE